MELNKFKGEAVPVERQLNPAEEKAAAPKEHVGHNGAKSVFDYQESQAKKKAKESILVKEMTGAIKELQEELSVGKTTDEELLEQVKTPTTSPTIKKKEQEQQSHIAFDEASEEKTLEDLDVSKSDKEDISEYLGDEDINFFSELIVEFMNWGFETALKQFSREGTISRRRQERLSKIYTRGLKRYNIKLSPVWAMVAVTVIVLGISAKESAKIPEKKSNDLKGKKHEFKPNKKNNESKTASPTGAANL